MKMFPLWLTCSACSTCFILKGVQIEQIRLLTISGGPGMDQRPNQNRHRPTKKKIKHWAMFYI